jgi:putative hydrolase of the HAD superfamily
MKKSKFGQDFTKIHPDMGCKIGLISDCSSEVPAIWNNTLFAELFDVAIFSCSVGMKKPDIRIYQLSAKQLEVKPQDCLYVGDGSSRELSGAMRAGMTPVLIRALDEPNDAHQIEAENWDGPTISSLQDVLTLIK